MIDHLLSTCRGRAHNECQVYRGADLPAPTDYQGEWCRHHHGAVSVDPGLGDCHRAGLEQRGACAITLTPHEIKAWQRICECMQCTLQPPLLLQNAIVRLHHLYKPALTCSPQFAAAKAAACLPLNSGHHRRPCGGGCWLALPGVPECCRLHRGGCSGTAKQRQPARPMCNAGPQPDAARPGKISHLWRQVASWHLATLRPANCLI